VLKDLYPQNHRLFCTILGVEDAKLATLIEEFRWMSTSWGLDYVLSLFLEVTKMLKDNNSVGITAEIRDNVLFPILRVGSLTGVDYYIRANDADEWFIADCTHFHRSFAGKIPLLALDVADVGRLKRLIQKAGIDQRRLSIVANGKAETYGGVEFLDAETRAFRSKVNSILRYGIRTSSLVGSVCNFYLLLSQVDPRQRNEPNESLSTTQSGLRIQGTPRDPKLVRQIQKRDYTRRARGWLRCIRLR
jgi:hypothetical protein